MVVVPKLKVAVAKPIEPAVLLIAAIPASDEVHVADDVRFWLPPFEYVPVAMNCMVVPGAMLVSTGVIERETIEKAERGASSRLLFPHPCTNAVRITTVSITSKESKLFFIVRLRVCFDATGGGLSSGLYSYPPASWETDRICRRLSRLA
jgi:hypothetical protein